MKIRTGFISNSSSSSFIIVLDKLPKNVKELEKFLFGAYDKDHYCVAYYNYMMTKKNAAKMIFNDLKKYEFNEEDLKKDFYCLLQDITYYDLYEENRGRKNTSELIFPKEEAFLYFGIELDVKKLKAMNKKHSPLNEEFYDHNRKDDKDEVHAKLLKEYHERNEMVYKIEEELVQKMYDNFMSDKKDKKVIRLEYSDNDGNYSCILEHSNALDPFKAIKISHH